jgi:hypothetical protein
VKETSVDELAEVIARPLAQKIHERLSTETARDVPV